MNLAKELREIASPAYRGFWAESAPILENAAKEIESLRQQLVDLSTDWWRQKRRGDEWKRRAKKLYDIAMNRSIDKPDHHERKWFEEEG